MIVNNYAVISRIDVLHHIVSRDCRLCSYKCIMSVTVLSEINWAEDILAQLAAWVSLVDELLIIPWWLSVFVGALDHEAWDR